jgi:hypothetical protein
MVTGLREFLETKAGKGVAAALIFIAVIAVFVSARRNLGESEAEAASRERIFICSKTDKPFELELREGMTIPVRSPYSDEDTGYLPELCYWTAEGTISDEPTYVCLNKFKNEPGPTFCKTCHRLVTQDNPAPGPESKPPPTEAEYAQRKGSPEG